MSEVVVKRNASLGIAAACLAFAVYCLQFVLLPRGIELPGLYVVALLLFGSMLLANFQGVRFTGIDLLPPNKWLIVTFWGSWFAIAIAYAMTAGAATHAPSRPAHLAVGLGLLVYFGLSCFGSFFSGFGAYLFIRNPVSWLMYSAPRRRRK